MSFYFSLLQAKQFTIIQEVLGDTKLNELSEQERRSLAFLKEATRRSAGGTPLYVAYSYVLRSYCIDLCMIQKVGYSTIKGFRG